MSINTLYFDFTDLTYPNVDEEFDLVGLRFSVVETPPEHASLDHSPADILRWALIDLGLGLEPPTNPWPIYASSEPDVPDNCITVYDTIGIDDGRIMFDGNLQQHQGVQVRIRSKDHAVGWTKAAVIRSNLAREVYDASIIIDSASYLLHSVNRISNVIALGKEIPTSKRSIFVINAIVSVKQLTVI